MIRELLNKQRDYLTLYFEELDCTRGDEIVHLLHQCTGSIVCSGVGKSGLVAQKIVATMISMGIKSAFLDPVDAIHGGLGSISSQDVVLFLSKSGESRELIELVPFIRKKGALTISIVSRAISRLSQLCDREMILPFKRELCPFDVAPTISTTVQMLFGDSLAVALMQLKKVTMDDFAHNHPGGLIGRRISLTVADVMQRGSSLPLCRPQDRLVDVLPELSAKRLGCLLVVDEKQHLEGVFTDGDLRRALSQSGRDVLECAIAQLMTRSPRWIAPDRLAIDALHQMEENPKQRIMALPVLEEGRVVGLVHLHDIVQN